MERVTTIDSDIQTHGSQMLIFSLVSSHFPVFGCLQFSDKMSQGLPLLSRIFICLYMQGTGNKAC